MATDGSSVRFAEEQGREKLLLFMQGQWRVLEMIASPVALATVLDELARVVEEQVAGLTCSVLLFSEDRAHLRLGAGASLPESYRRAIDGVELGAFAGSCGTAALQGLPVMVSDIAADPLWPQHYKELALGVGFKACWSTPIVSGSGEVLAVLALYHRQPLAPSAMHLGLMGLATRLAQIAIERGITERERQRVEDAKRLAEWYRMVLQATGEALFDWDLASGALCWSSGLAGFGYAAGSEERTLEWWIERLHPEDAERVRRSLERAVDSGQVKWEEEYRFRRMDGSFADVVDRGVFIRDRVGRALRMVGSLQDITLRKRHEDAMEQLVERFRAATVAGAVGTWRVDLKAKLFLADESLNLLLRGQEGEAVLTFDDVMRAVHPDDRERVARAIDEAVATGCLYRCDHRVVLADGEVRWLRSRGRIVGNVNGRAQWMTGAMSDFTELKHAEQSMAMLAEASRLLTESLDSGQILSTITRMVVPSFADAVVLYLKDPHTDEPQSRAHPRDGPGAPRHHSRAATDGRLSGRRSRSPRHANRTRRAPSPVDPGMASRPGRRRKPGGGGAQVSYFFDHPRPDHVDGENLRSDRLRRDGDEGL